MFRPLSRRAAREGAPKRELQLPTGAVASVRADLGQADMATVLADLDADIARIRGCSFVNGHGHEGAVTLLDGRPLCALHRTCVERHPRYRAA